MGYRMNTQKDLGVCCIKDCKNPVKIKKHRLCNAHVRRLYVHGTVGTKPVNKRKTHEPFKQE